MAFGPGKGSRLLAPGLPEVMVVSGDTRLWVNGSCIWEQRGDLVEVVDSAHIVGLAVSQGKTCIAWRTENGFRISAGVAAKGVEIPGARGVHVGVDWAVVDHGIERRVLCLADNSTPIVPVGARDARPKAWSAGRGVTWIDGGHVYRFKEGENTRLAGKTPGAVTSWTSGPHGSALFQTDRGVLGLGARGSLHEAPDVDVTTARFSPDGHEFIGATSDGVTRWSLIDQREQNSIRGRLYPAGYADGPVLLDEDIGTLRTWGGQVMASGFTPCAASIHKTRLYGPGGTAWSVETGERLWQDSPLAADHLMATDGGVIQVDDRIVGFDLDGEVAFDLPLPIDQELDGPIYSTHWVDGLMYFEVEDGWIQIDFEGRRVGTDPPPVSSFDRPTLSGAWQFDEQTGLIADEHGPLPILFDGAALRHDGTTLAWSEDGLLCILEPSPTG